MSFLQDLQALWDDIAGGTFLGNFPLETFGVDLTKLALQLVLWIVPVIIGVRHVVPRRQGAALFGWLFLIALLPIIGTVLALVLVRGPKTPSAT